MMNLEITATTKDLLARVKDWSVNEVRPHARESDDNYGSPEAAERVVAASPVGVCPLDFVYSGPRVRGRENDEVYTRSLNGGKSVLGLLCTEQMFVGDGWGWQALPGNNLGERAVRILGNPEQVERWAEPIIRGDIAQTSICMTEKHCGLDLSQIKTTATRTGDGWVLNGSKHWISFGNVSDILIVLAQTQPGSGFSGMRCFVVERADPGLKVVIPSIEKLGVRYFSQTALEFDNIELPEDRLLDGPFGTFLSVMNGTRPYCGASGIGVARGMTEYATDWVNAHDRPWESRRRTRLDETVAEMHAALDRARRMILWAGWIHDNTGVPDALASHKAKAYAAPIFQAVAFRAMQLMGPEAWSKKHLMEKWYRDCKFFDIVEGTGNMHRLAVARSEYGRAAA